MTELDLCFMPMVKNTDEMPAELIVKFLRRYYSVLSNKPKSWFTMVENLEGQEMIALSRM